MTKRKKGGKSLEEYFEFKYEDKLKVALCKLCCLEKSSQEYIKMTSGNTTGVKRHLQKFHEAEYSEIWETISTHRAEVNLN